MHLVPLAVCLFVFAGCGTKDASTKKSAPVKVEYPNEGDISRIVLTPQAEQRLQVRTVLVEKQTMPQTRTVGGVIAVPDGASVIVTAPWTGALLNPAETATPIAGQQVHAGQIVFQLVPLLSPEREVPTAAERVVMANATAILVSSQIVADGDTKQAQAQVEAAQIALVRAKKLFADKVGSERDVDDAIARLDIANKGLDAAQARKEMLDKLSLEAESGKLATIQVLAPQIGMLRNVTASIGQTVTLGAPLFEVVDLNSLWVRVPVYPGLRKQIDSQRNVVVQDLGQPKKQATAKPVVAPPSGDPLAATVDLFYLLDNSAGKFHPGERVEVTLPLAGETESLVVPRAAIIRDIHGVAWVYENSAKHEYRRRRVEVHFTTEKLAVLSQGPAVGTSIVVDGVAEIFGAEFGNGK